MKVDVTKVGEFIFVTAIAFIIPAALMLIGLYLSDLFKFSELIPIITAGFFPFAATAIAIAFITAVVAGLTEIR